MLILLKLLIRRCPLPLCLAPVNLIKFWSLATSFNKILYKSFTIVEIECERQKELFIENSALKLTALLDILLISE